MDWDNYHIFLEFLRAGSLSGAAKTVGMTHSTVRRRLEDMEHILGVVLFTRSPDGLKPTAAALKLKPAAIRMENAADSLLRSAAVAGSATGVVKIVCSEVMAMEVLPRAFAVLRALQPGLRLEVSIDKRPIHALGGGADISIQSVRPAQPGIASKRVCTVTAGFFAHTDYVSRFGAPSSVDDLKCHSLIGSDSETLGLDLLLTRGLDIDPATVVVRSDSYSAQLAAIRAGTGIGAIHGPLAARDPDMVRILPGLAFEMDVWLAMDEDLVGDRRVGVAFDLIADHLAAYARETHPSPPRAIDSLAGSKC